MKIKSKGYKIFLAVNYVIISLLALVCLLPLLNVLAISFSSSAAASTGTVLFWPKEFSLSAYEYCLNDKNFLSSMAMSVIRVIMGCAINVFLTVLCAYPLSKDPLKFKTQKIYAWFFVFTMLFNGGMIPTYLVVKETHLLDTVFSLILPGAVPVFNVILMLNFFRGISPALEDAALIDGAGHWRILWKIFFPLAAPAVATITLFSLVGHWNAWFDGMLYIKDIANQPVATYLQAKLVGASLNTLMNVKDPNTLAKLLEISNQTVKSALVFVGTLPIICIYPFLQKYFTTGLMLGGVKE